MNDDHPAPATMRDAEGTLHVAGEPPAGTIAPSQSPADESLELQSGDVSDPEARERLGAVVDHEPYPTERPDIGTE